jgi:hypothetical protein
LTLCLDLFLVNKQCSLGVLDREPGAGSVGQCESGANVVENSGSIVLSRSVCYAMLAALAIGLLILANAAPGDSWTAAKYAQGSFGSQGFHLSQVLTSAGNSAKRLRDQLHNTWLFIYVFLGVWFIVLTWGLFERRRLKLGVGRREVYWMGWMSLSVITTACLYGIGTNGIVARRYPKAVPISDALAIGFVLALPVFAWSRLQRRREEDREAEELLPAAPTSHAMLGLNAEDSIAPPRARFQEPGMRHPEEGIALQSLRTPLPDTGKVTVMDRSAETTVPVINQLQAVPAPLPEPIREAAPTAPVVSSTEGFREHLRTLNEAWGRIERSGQEIEQWFDEQRSRVISRLEMHPGARAPEPPPQISKDFLNEKLAQVDADWTTIRRSALEISRWFGDAPAAKS